MKERNKLNKIEKLSRYTKLAWDRGLTESTGGNTSIRIDDKIYITPTFFIKHFITKGDFVELNLNREKIKGDLEPSSEYKMHLKIYNERKDINCIFHAHPKWSTIYSVTSKKIPIRILPESIVLLGKIVYLPYKMPGTDEFADVFTEGLRNGSNVFVLANHGVTVCAKTIEGAYARLETLETCSYISAMAGMFSGKEPIQITKNVANIFLRKLHMK